MRCEQFTKEWAAAHDQTRDRLSQAATTHLASCPTCRDLTYDVASLETSLRVSLAWRAAQASPRPRATEAAVEAAVAALARPQLPARPALRILPGRSSPLRFVALPPAVAGWAVAAAFLVVVGLLGRAPVVAGEIHIVAQTATAMAARPSPTPSPTLELASTTTPAVVSLARPAATPLPQP